VTIVLYERADHPDIYYRCRWDSDIQCLLIDDKETVKLYVPGFEYQRAKAQTSDIEVHKLISLKEPLENITELVTTNNTFPYSAAKHISTDITVKREVYESRYIKTQTELAAITRAQQLTQEAIQIVISLLEQSELQDKVAHLNGEILTSEVCKLAARTHLLKHGADCPDLIVASGTQTGQPHNRGSGPIQEGPVIIDIFAQTTEKYHGDCTRTYLLGDTKEAQKMLLAVKQAHDECVQKCVPGQSISKLYEHAKNVLEEHGFKTNDETGFIHSLGHGLGLDIHESPNLSPKNTDALKEGMTITIEPGLYYNIGVRYENIVVVQNSPRILH
jgi:Xaa-Pro aminopeptidase